MTLSAAALHLVSTWLEIAPTPPVSVPSPSATPATFGANVIGFSFLLSLLVWGPAFIALVMAFVPQPRSSQSRLFLGIAFWTSAGAMVLTLIGYQQFQAFTSGLQFEERLPWLPAIGVSYHLGVDGIGMALLLLSGLVSIAAILASWEVRERARGYFALILLVESAVNGVVAARDLFLVTLFFTATILPVVVLVAGWGGARRGTAAGALLAYWGLGAGALLAAVLLLYRAVGATDFDLDTIGHAAPPHNLAVAIGVLLALAAATRLPLIPFHGWAREVYSEAPAGVVVVIAGVASRMGGYVLVRLLVGVDQDAARTLAPYLGGLAAATVVYAVLAALATTDVRRLAAYLAIVPGGITVLGVAGLNPLSLDGTVLSLFAGGLAAALVAGTAATLAERAQARSVGMAAGLASRAPKLSWLLLVGCLAVLGLPFLATFPAGLMVFMGAFRAQPGATFATAAGLLIAVAAVGRVMHRVVFGAPNPNTPGPNDTPLAASWYLGSLAGALLWVGLVPSGPKLFGVPIFDPGLVNIVNSSTADLAGSYAITPPPTPTLPPPPSPSSSPATPASPSPSP